MPLPDFRVAPGEPLTIDITLTDSADQVTLHALTINTAQGTLVIAGSAAAPIAPGGLFRVTAPGLTLRGPLRALTVTPDEAGGTTAITFQPFGHTADIEPGGVEIDLAQNAFLVTIDDADAIPYVPGGWLRVSGNSAATANRTYRIWSVAGGPASDQLTVRVEQPIAPTTDSGSGALQVLASWPVIATGGAVTPLSANGFSLEGHAITAQLRAAASVDAPLLAEAMAEIFEQTNIAASANVIDYAGGVDGGFLVTVDNAGGFEIGQSITFLGINTDGGLLIGPQYLITGILNHGSVDTVFLDGATSGGPPSYQSGGTANLASTTRSNRYRLTFTAEQTAALDGAGTAYLDILHSFTPGALPSTPVRASVASGGVTLATSVAAGTDHLRIPSSPWRVRIVPAVTAVEA